MKRPWTPADLREHGHESLRRRCRRGQKRTPSPRSAETADVVYSNLLMGEIRDCLKLIGDEHKHRPSPCNHSNLTEAQAASETLRNLTQYEPLALSSNKR